MSRRSSSRNFEEFEVILGKDGQELESSQLVSDDSDDDDYNSEDERLFAKYFGGSKDIEPKPTKNNNSDSDSDSQTDLQNHFEENNLSDDDNDILDFDDFLPPEERELQDQLRTSQRKEARQKRREEEKKRLEEEKKKQSEIDPTHHYLHYNLVYGTNFTNQKQADLWWEKNWYKPPSLLSRPGGLYATIAAEKKFEQQQQTLKQQQEEFLEKISQRYHGKKTATGKEKKIAAITPKTAVSLDLTVEQAEKILEDLKKNPRRIGRPTKDEAAQITYTTNSIKKSLLRGREETRGRVRSIPWEEVIGKDLVFQLISLNYERNPRIVSLFNYMFKQFPQIEIEDD